MKAPHRKLTRATVAHATAQANRHINDLRKRLADFDNAKAGHDGQCKYCTFIRPERIGGAAITEGTCGLCERPMTFGNTCTDRLCPECAHDNGLCRHCGGDLELKDRRKPYPFEDNRDA